MIHDVKVRMKQMKSGTHEEDHCPYIEYRMPRLEHVNGVGTASHGFLKEERGSIHLSAEKPNNRYRYRHPSRPHRWWFNL